MTSHCTRHHLMNVGEVHCKHVNSPLSSSLFDLARINKFVLNLDHGILLTKSQCRFEKTVLYKLSRLPIGYSPNLAKKAQKQFCRLSRSNGDLSIALLSE